MREENPNYKLDKALEILKRLPEEVDKEKIRKLIEESIVYAPLSTTNPLYPPSWDSIQERILIKMDRLERDLAAINEKVAEMDYLAEWFNEGEDDW